jgi:hypothetical protein
MFGGWIRSLWKEEKMKAGKSADMMRSKSAQSADYKRAKARKKRNR